MGTQLKQRVLMSCLSIFCLIFMISYSHHPIFKPIFILCNAVLISLTLIEFYQLAQKKGYQPLIKLGIISSILYLIGTSIGMRYSEFSSLPFFFLLGSLLAFFLAFFEQTQNSIVNLSITTFGILYLAIPITCIIQITYFESPHHLDHGRLWLAYVLTVTKITDIGAYIVGKTMGKNKLAEHISPKKTIEGALGGTFISLVASLLFYFYFFSDYGLMTLAQSILVGLMISILAQIGDLSESVLKRDANVKDSSRLPGFGGMLDVMDSLVFTLPFMYLLLQMQLIG